jgi:hypothetical protein
MLDLSRDREADATIAESGVAVALTVDILITAIEVFPPFSLVGKKVARAEIWRNSSTDKISYGK